MINYKATGEWFLKRGIILERSFAEELRRLVKIYKKTNGVKNTDEVYKIIGIKKQHISYWENHPYSAQTKNFKAKGYRSRV